MPASPLPSSSIAPDGPVGLELFHPAVLEGHLQDHLERRVNIGYHLWGLMILLLWMKKWNVQGPKRTAAVRLEPAIGALS